MFDAENARVDHDTMHPRSGRCQRSGSTRTAKVQYVGIHTHGSRSLYTGGKILFNGRDKEEWSQRNYID